MYAVYEFPEGKRLIHILGLDALRINNEKKFEKYKTDSKNHSRTIKVNENEEIPKN